MVGYNRINNPFSSQEIIMTIAATISPKEYRRRIWAWTMYDWANSAFATTILAAVLPVYFSRVAGSSLPSAAVATSYWSFGLSISLLIVAILAPILGTVSDVIRGKKRFLAIFAGVGILCTALLVLVSTGDWVLASILGILGRIGFTGSITFYDSLLPHVAKPEDQDKVSTRGYAMGYLGGGLLLAVNIVMIQLLPGTWGARLSFLSVAIWWAIFSIPLFRHVPEPETATGDLRGGIIRTSFKRLGDVLADIRQYRELFKYLIAFLIYNDGIGTIIGVAAIYGAELGLGSVELILALLLVQFVAMPYSLIFGRLPSQGDKRRPFFLAFVIFNLIALPLVGLTGLWSLPANISGARPARFETRDGFMGEGAYMPSSTNIQLSGTWAQFVAPASKTGGNTVTYFQTDVAGAQYDFSFNGQHVEITYSMGPDYGIWEVEMDGQPLLEKGKPVTIDAYNRTVRYDEMKILQAAAPGEHTLRVINSGGKNPKSQDTVMTLASIEVLPGVRHSNLGAILGIIAALELVGLGLAWLSARLFTRPAEALNTKRSIFLALAVYAVIAVWGFFLDSTMEFWFLAWMVAIVQGGSQALSRSLYASMSPAAKSGEFFGLFGVMEKFSSIIGPLLFGLAGTLFGSSRPAVLSLILLFIIGGYLLTRVNVEEGRRVARMV
jgi:UMF1 family MFS transporter